MKNILFVGGPMNGRFSPTPNDSSHVVAKSDNIIDPRTGKHKEWKYYRKYISSKPVKRRDGRKVPRHVDVFVFEGHKMDGPMALTFAAYALANVGFIWHFLRARQ